MREQAWEKSCALKVAKSCLMYSLPSKRGCRTEPSVSTNVYSFQVFFKQKEDWSHWTD